MVEPAGVSFAWIECGRGAADDYPRAGRTERDRAGAGWGARRGTHGRIAGGGATLRRASVFHTRAGYWIFEESGPGAEGVGKFGVGRYGTGNTDLPAGRGDQRLGRRAFGARASSGERNFDAASGDRGG